MEENDFDRRQRFRSPHDWYKVGQKFGGDGHMVWQEIPMGSAVAGFVAVLIPASFW